MNYEEVLEIVVVQISYYEESIEIYVILLYKVQQGSCCLIIRIGRFKLSFFYYLNELSEGFRKKKEFK